MRSKIGLENAAQFLSCYIISALWAFLPEIPSVPALIRPRKVSWHGCGTIKRLYAKAIAIFLASGRCPWWPWRQLIFSEEQELTICTHLLQNRKCCALYSSLKFSRSHISGEFHLHLSRIPNIAQPLTYICSFASLYASFHMYSLRLAWTVRIKSTSFI